jgi:RNA polymerase sigma factor (sigma-70 family)
MSKIDDGAVTSRFESWEAVIERHYQKLIHYAYRLTGNSVEAEDIVHEAVCRVLKMDVTSIKVKSTYSYLRKVAKNVFVDKLYKEKVEQHVSLDDRQHKDIHDQLFDGTASQVLEDSIHYRELMSSLPVRILLAGLSEREVKLLSMNAVEEMRAEEIADVLNEDVYKVRYELNRLYARIRYRARTIMK